MCKVRTPVAQLCFELSYYSVHHLRHAYKIKAYNVISKQWQQQHIHTEAKKGSNYTSRKINGLPDVLRDANANIGYTTLLAAPPLNIPVNVGKELVEPSKDIYFSLKNEGIKSLGKYECIRSARFFGKCPEGVADNLKKDLALCKDTYKYFGMMLRSQTMQIICQMKEFARHRDRRTSSWTIPQRGFLLCGPEGAGKSCILQHIVWWARNNGWLVIFENHPDKYLKKCATIIRSTTGVYIQASFGRQVLETLIQANQEKLEKIPVNMKYYGKQSLDGIPINKTQKVFQPLLDKSVTRQLKFEFFKDHPEFNPGKDGHKLEQCLAQNTSESLKYLKRRLLLQDQFHHLIHISTIRDKLSSPNNLLDIAQFGVENSQYSVACVSEILYQIQLQTKYPVLVAVDNFNNIFRASKYVSIRYDLTNYHGYIPGPHLALPRLFSQWDGGNYKRGIKIAALKWSKTQETGFKPFLLGVDKTEIIHIPNFTPYEFDYYIQYMAEKSAITEFPKNEMSYYYSMSNGNGSLGRKALATFY